MIYPIYPTKEKILAKPWQHPKSVIAAVKRWKKRSYPKPDRTALRLLIATICRQYRKKTPAVIFFRGLSSSYYQPHRKRIILKNNSVITVLHELAHHLYGPSEFTACRWSVWLFKKIFPEIYSKLTWKGHMLYAGK